MIRKLPNELIREIAAGEIINAPVDVLKELLENALDAKANRLEITLVKGGCERIIVNDNGLGIAKTDLTLASEQHSTSKLASLSDINTLGFRGEGLYAIRYAARLELSSRKQEDVGGATLIAEGNTYELKEHPAPKGTRASVSHLFARLPARLHSLEHPSEALKKAIHLLGRYLLHHPHLKIKLITDDHERWSYAGGSFSEAAKFIWGPVTSNRLLPVKTQTDGLSLEGLLSRPELTRPRRDRLFLAVNGRPVDCQESWIKLIVKAYKELLPSSHFPVMVLNLSLPAQQVLVNTSPDKRKVKFLNEDQVLTFIYESINSTLSQHPLAPALPTFEAFEGVTAAPQHDFPSLQYLASYNDLYLLAEARAQLWVIDQHAAHERIIFEELSQRYKQEPAVELSEAELLPLAQDEVASYLSRREQLADLGLELEGFGGQQWRIRRVPAFLAAHPKLIAEVVKGSLGHKDVHDAWRAILGRLACLPAIKAGHKLSDTDAQHLLEALRQCETPWACPHGRPTALVLSEVDLARRFGRRGNKLYPKEKKVKA